MNVFRNRRFFSFWFGVGIPPFLVGTLVIAFRESRIFGIITLIITAAWVFDTFSTVCRRCPFYGTGKCGIPSLAVPLVLSRRSAHSISEWRVRLHFYADVAMILYVNWVYWHYPPLFPFVAGCSLIGWLIVFRPKRFHGLLFRLKASDSRLSLKANSPE